jgi:hypothetical protein
MCETRDACDFNEEPGFIVELHSFGVGLIIKIHVEKIGARGSVVGWGTVLQAEGREFDL